MFLKLWILITCMLEGCLAQEMNFTLGNRVITSNKLQEKSDDISVCYVDVVVYNSSSFKYGLINAVVTAISGDIFLEKTNYSAKFTNINGHACLPVNCHSQVRVFVEKNVVRISALNKTMQQLNLPAGFRVTLETNNEVVQFYSYAWGQLFGKSGPVYSHAERQQCAEARPTDNHIVFSYLTYPDKLVSTLQPPLDHTNPLDPNFANAWRYGLDGSSSPKRSCFFKIKVTSRTADVQIEAYSLLNSEIGAVLGLFETGAQYDVSASDTKEKAACVEFRCPAVDLFSGDEMNTFIRGNITVNGSPSGCCVSNRQADIFEVKPKSFKTRKPLEAGDSYGSEKGIYIHENPRIARAKCFTGREFLGSEYSMNVSTGFAFEYNCLIAPSCKEIVIGK